MLKSRPVRAAAGLIFALAVAGVAVAYWTSGGTGSGTATGGSSSGVTVTQTSTINGLYPGGPAQTLSGKFNNPNSGAVFVNSVTASLSSVSNGASDSNKPPCTTADFTLSSATASVGADVPSGNGQGSWSGPTVQMKDTASNQDNCQNATLNISYTSN